jgi:hypothetical protein
MVVIIHPFVLSDLLTPFISFATVASKPGGVWCGDDDFEQSEAAGAEGAGQRR